jgi:hypothetical protein
VSWHVTQACTRKISRPAPVAAVSRRSARIDITIPPCLAHLPMHGNLPVPWFTAWPNGKPDFRMRDPKRNNEAVRNGLCGICGRWIQLKPRTATLVYVVGPLCLKERVVYGPPQHEECARAAIELCPFLALEERDRSERAGSENTIVPREEVPPKPSRVGLAFVRRYSWVRGPSAQLYSFIDEPERVEWWTYQGGKLRLDPIQS